ncbi:MAG TPA: delta-60 repeat domain-containing protein [Verrucomicrobiae bacterium]|jgi:uncharacterized delta-60 repeat protein|nr:delta-60 repeat domain-containing protein [Verrucomicrobiae bacterium]
MKTKYILFTLFCAMAAGAATFLDPTFNPGAGANGLVESVVPLASGKILICGSFTAFDNKPSSYVARLNADGSLDTTFSASPSYWVRTMAVQGDGKIVIGGFFTSVSGASRNLVARLNADGSLDTSFDPGTGATGTLGGAITGNPDPFIFATAVQGDGKILITGNFTNYNGATRWGIARLNANGSLDDTFNVGAGFNTNSWGRSLLVQKNGQIMVTGWFTSYDNHSYNRMVRLNANGAADTTFNPSFGDLTAIYTVQELANGQYLVAGDSQNPTLFRQNMARLNADGSADAAFVGADNDKTESLRLQADGKILIGGYFSQVEGTTRQNLARLNSDGTLDTTFTPAVDNFVWSIAVQSNGRILIVGAFSTVEGASRNGIARLLPTATDTPPPAQQFAAGTYSGLFYNADNFTNTAAGYIVVTVTARGTYSARLSLQTTAYAWTGRLDSNSVGSITINRPRRDPIAVKFELQGDNSIQGTVTIGALNSTLMAYPPGFTRTSLATNFAGRYTALMGGGEAGAPAGDGWLSISVNRLGQVAIVGMLADGVLYSRATTLSATGVTPFYITYRNGTDTAIGWLQLGANVSGSVYWEKGFTATLPVTGEAYVPPARGHSALGISNAALQVSGGDLTNSLTAAFTLQTSGRFTFTPATNRISGILNPVNGVFAGQFLNPATRHYEVYRGVVLQNQNSGAGFSGTQGGRVTLGAP